jgi:arylsulfatase A-like enzyme
MDTVRELQLDSNTLLLFTSDNGGTPRAVNRPLRGHKGSTWEGGMRVPTIAWWPGQIPPGTEHDGICGMIDILPTLVKLAGGKLPADRTLDGADIRPILSGAPDVESPHDTFYYFRGLKLEAVRHGDWKLRLAASDAGDGKKKQAATGPQLYHLAGDIGETTDVAAANPDIVRQLVAVADRMKDDLGMDGIGPGVRKLGKVDDAEPLIGYDGRVRKGFEVKGP